jgi:hypothetical protein
MKDSTKEEIEYEKAMRKLDSIKRLKKATKEEVDAWMRINNMTWQEFLEWFKTLAIETEMKDKDDNVEER